MRRCGRCVSLHVEMPVCWTVFARRGRSDKRRKIGGVADLADWATPAEKIHQDTYVHASLLGVDPTVALSAGSPLTREPVKASKAAGMFARISSCVTEDVYAYAVLPTPDIVHAMLRAELLPPTTPEAAAALRRWFVTPAIVMRHGPNSFRQLMGGHRSAVFRQLLVWLWDEYETHCSILRRELRRDMEGIDAREVDKWVRYLRGLVWSFHRFDAARGLEDVTDALLARERNVPILTHESERARRATLARLYRAVAAEFGSVPLAHRALDLDPEGGATAAAGAAQSISVVLSRTVPRMRMVSLAMHRQGQRELDWTLRGTGILGASIESFLKDYLPAVVLSRHRCLMASRAVANPSPLGGEAPQGTLLEQAIESQCRRDALLERDGLPGIFSRGATLAPADVADFYAGRSTSPEVSKPRRTYPMREVADTERRTPSYTATRWTPMVFASDVDAELHIDTDEPFACDSSPEIEQQGDTNQTTPAGIDGDDGSDSEAEAEESSLDGDVGDILMNNASSFLQRTMNEAMDRIIADEPLTVVEAPASNSTRGWPAKAVHPSGVLQSASPAKRTPPATCWRYCSGAALANAHAMTGMNMRGSVLRRAGRLASTPAQRKLPDTPRRLALQRDASVSCGVKRPHVYCVREAPSTP